MISVLGEVVGKRSNRRETFFCRIGDIGANGTVSAISSNFFLRPARYLSGSSAIALMISTIVFSIN